MLNQVANDWVALSNNQRRWPLRPALRIPCTNWTVHQLDRRSRHVPNSTVYWRASEGLPVGFAQGEAGGHFDLKCSGKEVWERRMLFDGNFNEKGR